MSRDSNLEEYAEKYTKSDGLHLMFGKNDLLDAGENPDWVDENQTHKTVRGPSGNAVRVKMTAQECSEAKVVNQSINDVLENSAKARIYNRMLVANDEAHKLSVGGGSAATPTAIQYEQKRKRISLTSFFLNVVVPIIIFSIIMFMAYLGT